MNKVHTNNQWSTSLWIQKSKPRCCAKSPTVQNVFQPIPGLINCAWDDWEMGHAHV